MQDVFTSIGDYETLSKRVHALEAPITDLLKQTVVCCGFIQEYLSHNFSGEIAIH